MITELPYSENWKKKAQELMQEKKEWIAEKAEMIEKMNDLRGKLETVVGKKRQKRKKKKKKPVAVSAYCSRCRAHVPWAICGDAPYTFRGRGALYLYSNPPD